MKKILHVIPSLRKGGAERLVLDICNYQSKQKDCEVKLVCFNNINEYEYLSKNIDIKIIKIKIKLSFFKKNIIDVKEFNNFIFKFSPDIIHTHLFFAELVSSFCTYSKAKWILHAHDNMKQFLNFSIKTLLSKRKMANYYEKKQLLKNYKKNGERTIIAISKNTQKYFSLNVPQISNTLLLNAIVTKNFKRIEKKN